MSLSIGNGLERVLPLLLQGYTQQSDPMSSLLGSSDMFGGFGQADLGNNAGFDSFGGLGFDSFGGLGGGDNLLGGDMLSGGLGSSGFGGGELFADASGLGSGGTKQLLSTLFSIIGMFGGGGLGGLKGLTGETTAEEQTDNATGDPGLTTVEKPAAQPAAPAAATPPAAPAAPAAPAPAAPAAPAAAPVPGGSTFVNGTVTPSAGLWQIALTGDVNAVLNQLKAETDFNGAMSWDGGAQAKLKQIVPGAPDVGEGDDRNEGSRNLLNQVYLQAAQSLVAQAQQAKAVQAAQAAA